MNWHVANTGIESSLRRMFKFHNYGIQGLRFLVFLQVKDLFVVWVAKRLNEGLLVVLR